VRLLHWNASEAAAYLEQLHTAGYQVEYDSEFRPGMLRIWRESPPAAFVIDLSRLPSHGREIAVALRQSPASRHIPIVFCGGAEEKVSRIRTELPDAVFCGPANLPANLKRVIAKPPRDLIVPTAMMERCASRTAPQKLGITEGSKVALLDPPRDYARVLGGLPPNVQLMEDLSATAAVTLCFVQSLDSLDLAFSSVRGLAQKTKLWILWRKGGPRVTERLVRERGIELGLVDYKICSVNDVWSGMLFASKEKTRKSR